MAEFKTKLHQVYAVTLVRLPLHWKNLQRLIYTKIFTVIISLWKIYELILSVTEITERCVWTCIFFIFYA